MNRNLLYFFVCAIIFGGILVCSCKDEEDTDLIIGKWRSTDVIENSDSSPCALQSHIEFSDYVFDPSKRQMFDVVVRDSNRTVELDDEGDTIGYKYDCRKPINTVHAYTVSKDTLTIENIVTHVKTRYIIMKIDNKDMVWKSLTQEAYYKYTRWD